MYLGLLIIGLLDYTSSSTGMIIILLLHYIALGSLQPQRDPLGASQQ